MVEDEPLRYQILVRMTQEEHEEITRLGANEMRKAANMARVLLREALAARRAKVEPIGMRRSRSGERKRPAG